MMAVGFFFQAEDGIRVLYVTGVQTCALPIWLGDDALVTVYYVALLRFVGCTADLRALAALFGDEQAAQARVAAQIGRASCRERGWIWGVAEARQRSPLGLAEDQRCCTDASQC